MGDGLRDTPGDETPDGPEGAEEPDSGESSTVGGRLSARLSPQAKKRVLVGDSEALVRVLVQLSASADPDAIRCGLAELKGEAGAWMKETRLLSAEVAAGRLAELAELPGVVYIDLATRYR